jgi:hypothetical protein
LLRVFHVGFQASIEFRFQTANALIEALDKVEGPTAKIDGVATEIAAFNTLMESHALRAVKEVQKHLEAGSAAFLRVFNDRLRDTGLVAGGGGPSLRDGGRACGLNFFIVQKGSSEPKAHFSQNIELTNGLVVAMYAVETDRGEDKVEYYRGPAVDGQSLIEASEAAAPDVVAKAVRCMTAKLSKLHSRE